MTREFIMTPEFDKNWEAMGLTDSDLKNLQEIILLNPQVGKVIPGTSGLRKMRFAIQEGKRSGARILYVDLVLVEEVYLITAYAKGDKEDISESDKSSIRRLIDQLKNSAKERRRTSGNE